MSNLKISPVNHTGIIVHWGERGYGWIKIDGDPTHVFVHKASCYFKDPKVGDRVRFNLYSNASGSKREAMRVKKGG